VALLFASIRLDGYAVPTMQIAKRFVDIVAAAGLLILLSPIMLLLAGLIRLTDPSVFIQRNGRLKFGASGPIGRLIRRFSMDELPTLIDVLFGKESFFNREWRQAFLGFDQRYQTRERSSLDRVVYALIILAVLALLWSLTL
jgi:hypothetical protein